MAAEILVTGGAGYIGSHCCIALAEAGFRPVILDNFSNSHPLAVSRLSGLIGCTPAAYRGDIENAELVSHVLNQHDIAGVLHFAARKTVAGSVDDPLRTYDQNIACLISLLHTLEKAGLRHCVFSSSATVYGEARVPVPESAPVKPVTPYGHSKAMAEQILMDLAQHQAWSVAILRYFNPVGAHASGEIGEDPLGVPDNLFPYITQVAAGRRSVLNIFGNDFATADGTGVRDYIHVMDLAEGHVLALKHSLENQGAFVCNLGTGHGHSVQQAVDIFRQVSGRPIPTRITPRRAGDVGESYADVSYASDQLGFKARYTLKDMCRDAWRWQVNNPFGYRNGEADRETEPASLVG